MPRQPSIENLRLFMLVANLRSFSRAAGRAHVSQPALSRSIKLLEEDLGVRLFDRNSRNVALTDAGKTLLPIVERLTSDFDDAFSRLSQDFDGTRGRISIGAIPSIAARILPGAIASFIEARPHVEIVVRDQLSGTLSTQLRNGQIHLAFMTPPDRDDITFTPLFDDGCVFVCRKNDRLDRDGPLGWSVFEDNRFIAMAPPSSVRELTDTVFIRTGLNVRPLYECSQLATLGGLIGAGLGVSALPKSALGLLNLEEIAWHPLRDPLVSRTIGIAHSKDRTLPPTATAFLEHFMAFWPQTSIPDKLSHI